ncbi:hypothetical protein [uncultured Desulfuromusa sp.]|uniref:hypothetical protein n=1 Tax=uncultured Desulfuromusa sp. TaxID=219183 RepID=UPI002AA7A34C|nr:hypothetical protein [uncultured Desulfuromusa sp.]
MVTEQFYLFLVGSVALLALLIGFWQLRVSGKLSQELGKLRQELLKTQAEAEPKPSFSNSLDRVEQEQKGDPSHHSRAEKYRYVASLAAQGFDAQGIAVALQMAPVEVEQLLKLSQLKHQAEG